MGMIRVAVIPRVAINIHQCVGMMFGSGGIARKGQRRQKQRQNQQPRQKQTAGGFETLLNLSAATQRDTLSNELNISVI